LIHFYKRVLHVGGILWPVSSRVVMKINLLDLSHGVLYRGEGNANLVVALPSTQTVLRFPKSKFSEKCQAEKLDAIANYVNHVLLPELPRFIDPVMTINLDWHQLHTIRAAVAAHRPSSRLTKDIFYPAALVMPDYSLRPPLDCVPVPGRPILAVELKPKLGHMPPRNSPHPHVCNFCLKQHYKLASGLVKFPSKYCPLDLFSGDTQRMMFAVEALLASPQNNLRIFREGHLMHDEDSVYNKACAEFLRFLLGDPGLLPSLLIAALSHDGVKPIPPLSPEISHLERTASPHCCPKSALPAGSVLGSVLRLQKQSQLSDEEAELTLESLLRGGWDLASLQAVVSDRQGPEDCHEVRLLRDYMLSVTAKDLSIILTLVECGNLKVANTVKVGEKSFCFKWSVVDLDPKNLNRISKYVEQKKIWLAAFQQSSIKL